MIFQFCGMIRFIVLSSYMNPFATIDLKHVSFSKHLDAVNLNMNAFHVFNVI